MSNKDLSLNPQKINALTWYYEVPKGLQVVHEQRDDDGQLRRTAVFVIPWGKVKKSLERKERK